jgi:hypothetical protein
MERRKGGGKQEKNADSPRIRPAIRGTPRVATAPNGPTGGNQLVNENQDAKRQRAMGMVPTQRMGTPAATAELTSREGPGR